MLTRLGSVLTLVLPQWLCCRLHRRSPAPQDDPQPPVNVVAGDREPAPESTYSLTLTLDSAISSGDLEPGQVDQARAAAAAAQAQTQADAGATESTGQRSNGSAPAAGANTGAAVVGECGFRAAYGAGRGCPSGTATIRPLGRCW